MKKLMTILGVFLFASIILTSCGGPEADAKKAAECMCDVKELMMKTMEDPTNEDLVKDAEELEKKCEKIGEEMDGKYEDTESEDTKKYLEALKEEMKKCE